MDHAHNIVKRIAVDRQSGVVGLDKTVKQGPQGFSLFDANDVSPRHHQVADAQVLEIDKVAQHGAGVSCHAAIT